MSPQRQTAIGLGLTAAIVGAWAALHVYAVFFFPLAKGGVPAAALLVALLCWLDVGLFIVAHDCMHGSLAPGRPKLNRAVGRLALALYAGFSFDRLRPKHFEHHRRPGTAHDPDFSVSHKSRFWGWYAAFFRQYFGLRELAVLSLLVAIYLLLGAPYPNLLLFWATPAILSSLQLFLFGTYLPHRPGAGRFPDRHRARSNGYGTLASLLSCFHFGYHHEHHLAPQLPWWRLPAERARRLSPAPPR
ncbi:beta-carotene ketolase [Sphingomonas parva]|uniref:Beta-carotene ketolase n=1 Tax=Sphingomonas parva TaxID=2555898 RepID=A0A4Y8ZXP1_9SPHN|nr:fatty acid desaturase [Sphingomonas parva]TFI56668.1 beta-carotene ketolase [Sphingomonas parva]TFI60337.1 beta-carotene ketolase [Sphingomonas parva]